MDMSIRFPGLGIEFEYVIRAFKIYGMEISVYGLLITLGMLMGLAFMLLEAKRAKENVNQCLMTFIWAVIGGVIGARLFYAVFAWEHFQDNYLDLFKVEQGGMSIYGGIFGAILMVAAYCRVRKVRFGRMADYASVGLVTAQMIGRWGDFFNRESFGDYTDTMFVMQLPLASVRTGEVTALMRENLVTIDGASYIQVHPAFLYESVWCLILLLVLLGYLRRRKFDGEVFMVYLTWYGFGRFFIEWLRTDQLLIPGIRISVSLLISAALFFVFGIVSNVERSMMRKREKLRKSRNEAYYEAEEKMAAEQDEKDAVKDSVKTEELETAEESVEENVDTEAVGKEEAEPEQE